jgi:SOS-response transcriptional repressor LexA
MLTARQKQLVDFIADETARHGVAPSRREIAKHLGLKSAGHVTSMVRACEKRGVLANLKGRARAVGVKVHSPRAKWFAFDDEAKALRPFNASAPADSRPLAASTLESPESLVLNSQEGE